MNSKKHQGHPHLTGEHRWGDAGQLVLFLLYIGIWITDSFIYHYSTFLRGMVPDYIRITVAGIILVIGWYLARSGMRAVFGITRDNPELITSGVFRIVRHPIYAGAILFYMGSAVITMSIASAAFWPVIVVFYFFISRYEERLLEDEFGDDYSTYKKRTGMLFPKLFK